MDCLLYTSRIYATVMAQPAWDEALAALESGKAKDAGGPSNKPWKRKKADKTLKPVRPKRVKQPEPAPDPEPIAKSEAVESPSLLSLIHISWRRNHKGMETA